MRAALYLALAPLLVAAFALGSAGAAASSAHYVPNSGDGFHYQEVIVVNDGVGNYTGYTDQTTIDGSIGVTGVLPNGTESADYQYTQSWADNQGQSSTITSSGNFTFSATTYHYVQGTDNQTGYANPYVWFYMNNSLPVGGSFYALNTPMTVESLTTSSPAATSPTGYAVTIYAIGSGSYQRNDSYGVFTATYTWKEYFDPATGYIVGYTYTEQDRNGANGFTYTDTLGVTSTTYALQAGPPPPTGPNTSSAFPTFVLYAGIALVILVVIIIVAVVVVARNRSHPSLPRHSGPTGGGGPVWAPPPVALGSAGGPAPQVILRETVKVNCRYCGTLMDSTATVCPKCGAPRT